MASTWDVRKGLDDFIKLSKMLSTDYAIIVVEEVVDENVGYLSMLRI